MVNRSDENPDALADAAPPTIERIAIDGAPLHVEVRGSGNAVLIIGAADEDAEIYRGVAERLATTRTVVTYDRRGTGRSGRAGWPTGSDRHADDAFVIIETLNLDPVVVLGASAGAIVALRLALRHPRPLKAVLCFEPGIFDMADGGAVLRDRVQAAVDDHLRAHPGDWTGASAVMGREASRFENDRSSLFAPPSGREWFADRAERHAESLIRGDAPLTREVFDRDAIAACGVPLRFAWGTASLPVFAAIAQSLAALRGESADALEGVGHSIFHHPDRAAGYVAAWV